MKVLLVIPQDFTDRHRESVIPLGAAYINAALRQLDIDVITCNMNYLGENPFKFLKNILKEEKVDVICCGGTSFSCESIRKIFEYAKSVKKDIITIGGGAGYTAQPQLFAEITNPDYVVLGEGEQTIQELILFLKEGGDVTKIAGILYRSENGYVATAARPLIENIDDIPFPNYEGMGVEDFFEELKEYEDSTHFDYEETADKRVLPILFGRSCPYKCKFCFHTIGNKYRHRSLDNFFKELDQLIDKYHISGLIIVDEFFGIDKKIIQEFCLRIEQYNLKWFAEIRADIVSDDMVKSLKKAGCINLLIGLESMEATILKDMRKQIAPEQIAQALDCIYDNAIRIAGNFIFITPEETQESFYKTFDWWNRHRKYQIELLHLQLFPGTQYYFDAVKNGIITNERLFLERRMPELNYSKLNNFEWDRARRMILFSKIDGIMDGRIEVIDDTSLGLKCKLTCRHCFNEFEKMIKKTRNYDSKNHFIRCPHCGQHTVYSFKKDYSGRFENELYLQQSLNYAYNVTMDSWLNNKKYRKVVLYGHGYNLTLMYEELEKYCCNVKAVTYVDLGELHIYGGTVFDNIISLDRVSEMEGIDAVIICQTVEYSESYKLLRANGYKGKIDSMVNAIMQHDYFIEENVW